MPNPIFARVPYFKSSPTANYNPGHLDTELQKIQRAIPPTAVRITTLNDSPSILDRVVLYDATNNPITVTIPPANQVQNVEWTFKKLDSSSNHVTIQASVDGTSPTVLTTQYASVTIVSSGNVYSKIGGV